LAIGIATVAVVAVNDDAFCEQKASGELEVVTASTSSR
jgi:hypothetical protein